MSYNNIPVKHAQELLAHIETSRETMNIQSKKVIDEFVEKLDTIDPKALEMIVELMLLDMKSALMVKVITNLSLVIILMVSSLVQMIEC